MPLWWADANDSWIKGETMKVLTPREAKNLISVSDRLAIDNGISVFNKRLETWSGGEFTIPVGDLVDAKTFDVRQRILKMILAQILESGWDVTIHHEQRDGDYVRFKEKK